ncbi:unnamed protein product, partial [Brugia timori]
MDQHLDRADNILVAYFLILPQYAEQSYHRSLVDLYQLQQQAKNLVSLCHHNWHIGIVQH